MPQNNPELAILERLKEHLRFYKYQGPEHTIRNLASYCRVSEQTIFNWLKGKTKPGKSKLKLMQEWLAQKTPDRVTGA